MAAISSISPTHRQPFADPARAAPIERSTKPGCDVCHSSNKAVSTPLARAAARIVRSSAALPFVQCGKSQNDTR